MQLTAITVPVIHKPFVYEILAEKYDNALDLLTPSSLVFGGAIRDAVAGLSLQGDLDIIVSKNEAQRLLFNFAKDSKWIPDNIKALMAIDKNKSKYSGKLLIDMRSFTTSRKAQVQILSIDITANNYQDLFPYLKTVDIICCGLCMDRNGIIYEVITGALNDCENKELRLNPQAEVSKATYEKTVSRIEKLKGRGWTSKISTSELNKLYKKSEKVSKTAQSEKIDNSRNHLHVYVLSNAYFSVDELIRNALSKLRIKEESLIITPLKNRIGEVIIREKSDTSENIIRIYDVLKETIHTNSTAGAKIITILSLANNLVLRASTRYSITDSVHIHNFDSSGRYLIRPVNADNINGDCVVTFDGGI